MKWRTISVWLHPPCNAHNAICYFVFIHRWKWPHFSVPFFLLLPLCLFLFLSFWPIFFITYYTVVVDRVFYSTRLKKKSNLTRLDSWNFQLDPHLVGVDRVFESTQLEKSQSHLDSWNFQLNPHLLHSIYPFLYPPFWLFSYLLMQIILGYRFSKIQNLTTGNCLRILSHQKKMKNSKHLHYYWQKKVRLWLNKSSLIRWLKKIYIIIAFSWKISVLTSYSLSSTNFCTNSKHHHQQHNSSSNNNSYDTYLQGVLT